MNYTKLKVELKDAKNRLYRILAIKGDPELYDLGVMIGLSVEATFEHFYLFHKNFNSYVADSWLSPNFKEYLPLRDHRMSDLRKKFIYEYDTGEGYEFNCTVLEDVYNYASDDLLEEEYPCCFVIEGKGQGIFENNHGCLDDYLDGCIDPNSDVEDEEKGWFLPSNMDFDKYGDFDAPLDLEYLQFYQDEIDFIVSHFKEDDYEDETDFLDDDSSYDMDYFDLKQYDIRSILALMIFENKQFTDAFKRLMIQYDITDAFEMMCDEILPIFIEAKSEKELEKMIEKALKKLK